MANIDSKIYCFGDCNIDMPILIDNIPVNGGCCFSDRADMGIGGSMLNTCVALSKMGLCSVPVTKLGNDIFGDMIYSYLKEEWIPIFAVVRADGYQTGLIVGLVENGGEKYWVSVRLNASDIHITYEDLEKLEDPECLFITGVELNEGKESRTTAIAYAEKIHSAGGKVYLDPTLRVPDNKIPKEVFDAFANIMPYVDVFLANEEELIMLGGSKDIEESCKKIKAMGAGHLWTKLGGDGCCFYDGLNFKYFNPEKIKAIDTSGAGDSFNAAIIYSELNGFDVSHTGKFANMFAAYVVERIGTIRALPSYEETMEMIRRSEL